MNKQQKRTERKLRMELNLFEFFRDKKKGSCFGVKLAMAPYR